MLERAHRFICRVLQGLPPRTRSYKCTSRLGWLTIESYIDKCKLLFFGRLCRLNSRHLPKKILISRLLEFKYQCVDNQLGFVQADDIALLSPTVNGMQTLINICQ